MRTRRLPHIQAGLVLAAATLAACDASAPAACTSVFLAVTVTAVDSLGAPVTDATVTSRLARTGELLTPTSLVLLSGGTYIVVDDGSRGRFQASGDTVAVTAQRGTRPITAATYFIDVPGGCHVHQVSGPDTLLVP